MATITAPEFPGERLIVCRNADLAAERARKREDLLAATERDLTASGPRSAASAIRYGARRRSRSRSARCSTGTRCASISISRSLMRLLVTRQLSQ